MKNIFIIPQQGRKIERQIRLRRHPVKGYENYFYVERVIDGRWCQTSCIKKGSDFYKKLKMKIKEEKMREMGQ